jgi:hypothetical protein
LTEAQIRAALAEAAQALRLCSTGLRGMRIVDGQLEAVTRAMWPDWQRDEDELWYAGWSGLLPGTKTRTQNTNEQISKLDRVLPWFFKIHDPRWRKAVYLRAAWPKAGWRRIGHELGVSQNTAKAYERQGIEAIARALAQPGVNSWRWDAEGG